MALVPRLQTTRPIEQGDLNPVGMIVQSMLTEAQFQALNGTNWILADGRSVAGSAYATVTGNSTIPDARGLFLRGKNNGRGDGQQDPGGERSLGNSQTDAMQGHYHGLSNNFAALNSSAGSTQNYGTGAGTQGSGVSNPYIVSPSTDGSNGSPRTANETRPKNIAVNIFIKIN